MNESNDEADRLIGQLRQLQPARSNLDARQMFYQAGYEACRSQTQTRRNHHLAAAIAATLLAVMISVPTSYHAGKFAASVPALQKVADSTELRNTLPPEPSPPVLAAPSSIRPMTEREVTPEQPRTVELAARGQAKHPFESWMNPLPSIARSKKLDRQSESLFTTSHASMFALESSIRNLSELPLSVNPPSQLAVMAATTVPNSDDQDTRKTLAAGDLHALSASLEAIR